MWTARVFTGAPKIVEKSRKQFRSPFLVPLALLVLLDWLSSSFVLLRCPSPILHVTKDEMIASACTHHSMRMADLFDADVPLGLSGHAAWYMYELPMAAHGFIAYCFEIYIVVAADLGADLEWLRHRSTLPGSWAWRALPLCGIHETDQASVAWRTSLLPFRRLPRRWGSCAPRPSVWPSTKVCLPPQMRMCATPKATGAWKLAQRG